MRPRRYVLPGANVFPEGITEGPGTTFFVGSLGDGTIYRGDAATGEAGVFLPPDGDGRQAVAGLDVDEHGRLIACDFDGLVARRPLPAGSEPNDVVVVGDYAYLTDSGKPLIWRLPAGPDGIGEPAVAFDLSGVARPAPDWRAGVIVAELTDPAWNSPTTIAKAVGQLLVVCPQIVAKHLGVPPTLPFEVIGTDFPAWD